VCGAVCGTLNRYPPIQNLKNPSIIFLTQVSLLQTLGYEREALGTGISLHGGSAGQPVVGSSTRDFERWVKGALGGGLSLSLWKLCEGNPEGGLPCWGPWTIGRKGSGDGHLFP